MARITFHLRNARTALTVAGLVVATLAIGTPATLAKDAYPPGWNVKTDVPPSTAYTWIGGYNSNMPYWADQEWPTGRIPSRYTPDQCHWDWCRTMVRKLGTATAQVPRAK
jgi:hypothetical protein